MFDDILNIFEFVDFFAALFNISIFFFFFLGKDLVQHYFLFFQ